MCSGTPRPSMQGLAVRSAIRAAIRNARAARTDPLAKVGRAESPGRRKHAILPVCGPESRAGPVPRTVRRRRRRSGRRTRRGRWLPGSAPRISPRFPGLAHARARRARAGPHSAAIASIVAASAMLRSCSQMARPTAPASASACVGARFARREDPARGEVAVRPERIAGWMFIGLPRNCDQRCKFDQPVGLPLRRALRQRQARPTPETPRPG